ncbi:MAG: serine/threonine protein kinase [Candidatus Cloacimonetes bacterium]|nr:serine/threonine protein kinase [Candidatus Cloacimonadota bacterium]
MNRNDIKTIFPIDEATKVFQYSPDERQDNTGSIYRKTRLYNENTETLPDDTTRINPKEPTRKVPDNVTRIMLTEATKIFATLVNGIYSGRNRTKEIYDGMRIGNYIIGKQVAVGGMSEIYQVNHIYIKHQRILKALKARDERSMGSKRFLREAEFLSQLSHPNVVEIYDAGMEKDIPFIIMENVKGDSISDLLEAKILLPIEQVLNLLEDIANVLIRQEELGIIHRDIKPGNIMLRKSRASYCLIDYGISGYIKDNIGDRRNLPKSLDNLTQTGAIFGTPLYFSPEQGRGETLTIRSDIYSLGATVLECIVGREVFIKNKISTLISDISNSLITVPSEVKTIINNMVNNDPSERYSSPQKLLKDIYNYRYEKMIPAEMYQSTVFIAMPFAKHFNRVFYCIQRACSAMKLRPVRVDRSLYTESIWDLIVREIEYSSLIIADFSETSDSSGININVVTEASYARALKKPLCLISQQAPEKLPFDWKLVPFIKYEDSKEGYNKLLEDICNALRQWQLIRLEK